MKCAIVFNFDFTGEYFSLTASNFVFSCSLMLLDLRLLDRLSSLFVDIWTLDFLRFSKLDAVLDFLLPMSILLNKQTFLKLLNENKIHDKKKSFKQFKND